MRSYDNQPYETQCQGKRGYFSKANAKLAVRRMRGKRGAVVPYRCPHCGYWHLGGKRNDQQKAS